MKVASLLSTGREDQIVASRPILVTAWRRQERALCLEGQVRMACSNVSGSSLQRGQVVPASGDLQAEWAAR